MTFNLSNAIVPAFKELHKDVKKDLHTHYWLKGGRGSTKSSCISVEIILGMAKDPAAWVRLHYDKTRRRVYIFGEIYKVGMSNRLLCEEVKRRRWERPQATADSEEPKSIDECKSYGVPMAGAVKGAGSIETGIKFLQDLEAIMIDPTRCPNAAREFMEYELEQDGSGNFKSKYPDKNNHLIDSTRYAIEGDIPKNNGWGYSNNIRI